HAPLSTKQRSRMMRRKRILPTSALLAVMALSDVALAGPRITDKNYCLNEVHASSQSATRQTTPDWYGARAMVPGASPAQIVPEKTSGQYGSRRYQGGPKSPFW